MKLLFSSLIIASTTTSVVVVVAQQGVCPPSTGNCDFEPFNPHGCGAPDFKCGYSTICDAESAGYDIGSECCQQPQPSSCPLLFEPVTCGDKSCPYDNTCLAGLAGYSADQCTPVPTDACPTNPPDSCSSEPSNPYTCGTAKCPYESICALEEAGWDRPSDCCQDTRGNGACPGVIAPVSCGAPGGNQCQYDNECLAQAAGYNPSTQCCMAIPDGQVACTSDFRPVECGTIPCLFSNECLAAAAGYTDCCPQANGACTSDNSPVACGPNKCLYSSQSCADVAGFQSTECCKQPSDAELSTCTQEIAPLACSSANCLYDNACIAQLAGFDPASCVPVNSAQASDTNSTVPPSGSSQITYSTAVVVAMVSSIVAAASVLVQ